MLRLWIIGNNYVNVLRQIVLLHKTSTHHQEPGVLILCFLYLFLFYSQSDGTSSLPFYESPIIMDSVTGILNGKSVSKLTANIYFGVNFCCNAKRKIIDGIVIFLLILSRPRQSRVGEAGDKNTN